MSEMTSWKNPSLKKFLATAIAVAVVWVWGPGPVVAHEIVLVPSKRAAGKPFIIPAIRPGDHLAFSAEPLDFGGVILAEESILSLDLTNATTDTLDVQIGVASGTSEIQLSASNMTLPPGQTATLDVTFAPVTSGTLDTHLSFSSSHPGVAKALEETVTLTGQGLTPPQLVLRAAAGGQVQHIDFGEFPLGLQPTFAGLELANVGEAPLPQSIVVTGIAPVSQFVLNPFWHLSCSPEAPMRLCVFEPEFETTAVWKLEERLGGLPGGGTVPLTFELRTEITGAFSYNLDIDYGPYGALSIPAIGEVTPYDPEPAPAAGSGSTLAGPGGSGGDFVINTMAPTLARGLGADKIFDGVAGPDLVNLLNGNLTLGIPIGQEYRAGGRLNYSFSLRYNSNVWDFWDSVVQNNGDNYTVYRPQLDATAGVGWSLHLGRLCEPLDISLFRTLTAQQRRKLMCRDDRWHYIDASGATHFFRGELHGTVDAATQDGSELYTSDGSYIRMQKLGATTRELQFPDGTVHRFERREWWGVISPDGWQDKWRLTQIRDRNGNALSVQYQEFRNDGELGNQWMLSDGHRIHYIRFKPGTAGYYDRLVDVVDLAAFGGARAKYRFVYDTVTVDAPWDGHVDPGLTVTVPVLRKLERPDKTSYKFTYHKATGRTVPSPSLRAASVTLPTGGKIEWDYGLFASASPLPCITPSEGPHQRDLLGVRTRTVRDVDETVLDVKQFSQKLYKTALHTYKYCEPEQPSAEQPFAESVTAAVAALSLDSAGTPVENTVTLNYFSIFPLNQLAPDAPVGYTGHESGLPFTREVSLQESPASAKEFLSTQVYKCGAIDIAATQDPKQLVSGCELLRSQYVTYGRSPDWTHDIDVPAGAVNSRRISSRTLFHDDLQGAGEPHWIYRLNSGFDGLGHFRTTETSASFGASRYEKSYTNFNHTAGELIADGSGITQDITLPSVWTLNTSNRSWVQGSRWTGSASTLLPRRGGETCWTIQSDRLTLDRQRTWSGSGPGDRDIIVHYTYSDGDLIREEHFGGDTQTVTTATNWCAVALGTPQTTVDHTYASGELATTKTFGTSFLSVDRDIDAQTGLTAAQRDLGGIEVAYSYDSMGRPVEIRHTDSSGSPAEIRHATRVFDLQLPGPDAVASPRVTVRSHVQGQPANVLTEATVIFDALGRVYEEKEVRPGGTESKRRSIYWPRGWLKSTTTWQSSGSTFTPAWKTTYTYDSLGRTLTATAPDGAQQTMSHAGVRQTIFNTWVGTTYDETEPHGVRSSRATVTRDLDPFGRLEKVVTPTYAQTLEYDSLGQVTKMIRSQGGASQARSFDWDGRRLLTSESHPEKATVTYSEYDALGRAGQVSDGVNSVRFRYDIAGRLEYLDEGLGDGQWRTLKKFSYYPDGIGNGRLHTATRHHYLTADNTESAFPGTAGTWSVTEEYFYGSDGRIARRETQVTSNSGGTPASFRQTWDWNDLGSLASQTYPAVCGSTYGPTCATARTVTYGYSWGRLTSISSGDGLGASLSYHPNGLLATVVHDNGLVDAYGLDPKNDQRLWSISLASGFKYLGAHRYDDSGNLIRIGQHRYTYDLAGRLKEHYENGTREDWFAYDAFDNKTSINGIGQGANPVNNWLSSETFDADGRQIKDGCAKLHYDPLDLVRTYAVESSGTGCPAGNPTWVYLYNAHDRRVLNAGVTTGFQWEVRDLDGKILSTFKESAPPERVKDYAYRGRQALASRQGTVTQHFHLDHLGTARAISTASGSVLMRDFTPYGEPVGADHGEDLQFTGHQRNLNDETTYMFARTYVGDRGRFLTPDPARDGWNLYAYASNNPVNKVDPSGLKGLEDQDANEEEVQAVYSEEITVVAYPTSTAHELVRSAKLARKEGFCCLGRFNDPDPYGIDVLARIGRYAPGIRVGEAALGAMTLGPTLWVIGVPGIGSAMLLSSSSTATVLALDGKKFSSEDLVTTLHSATGGAITGTVGHYSVGGSFLSAIYGTAFPLINKKVSGSSPASKTPATQEDVIRANESLERKIEENAVRLRVLERQLRDLER